MKIADMIKLGVKGFKPADIRQINDSGIDTDSIINLAQNGYSAKDVNELITLAKESESLQPGNDEPDTQGLAGAQDDKGEPAGDDYKQKAESQEQEIQKLKEQLKAAQSQNAQKNLGSAEPVTPREEVKEAFRQIY